MSARRRSAFPISLFATPNPVHQEVFYTVPRAGHLVGGADHHIRRDHFPGHELILCLSGKGFVRVAGRTHRVEPGTFVWVNCHHPHEHGAVKSDPWEVYWVRIEGPRLARIWEILAAGPAPVFADFDHVAAEQVYREIFRLLSSDDPEAPALLHAAVARLVALAFSSRQRAAGEAAPQVPPALHRAVERMKLFYFEKHRAGELATHCGMSVSHFGRVFKGAFGTSPIDWLRRERISQAKRRLAETNDEIKQIGEQVGYTDRFFFSKDFKRITGMTPKEFRVSERGRQEEQPGS
jgi:AraC-like DNA-binding protein